MSAFSRCETGVTGSSDSIELDEVEVDNVLEPLLLGVRRLWARGESARRQLRDWSGVGNEKSLRGEGFGNPGVRRPGVPSLGVVLISCEKSRFARKGAVTVGLSVAPGFKPKMIGLTSRMLEGPTTEASP